MATALTRNSWKSTVERETKKKKEKEGEKQKIPMNFERRIAVGNANAERRRRENDCGGRLEMKRESRKERSFGTVSHNGRYFFFPPSFSPFFFLLPRRKNTRETASKNIREVKLESN